MMQAGKEEKTRTVYLLVRFDVYSTGMGCIIKVPRKHMNQLKVKVICFG